MKLLIQQATRFLVVGLLAMGTHFFIFVISRHFGVTALVANVIAFLVAFQVSFMGHFKWSFRDSGNAKGVAMTRFFTVSVGSFIVNELMFGALLKWTSLPEKLALLMVLLTVAGGTFLWSKFWAFSHKRNEFPPST